MGLAAKTRLQLVTQARKNCHSLGKMLQTAARLDASGCEDKAAIHDSHAQARKPSIRYLCCGRLALADGGVAHVFFTALGAGVRV